MGSATMNAVDNRPSETTTLMDVRLTAATSAARGTTLYRLARTDGRTLPSATAGSHIDLHLPIGLIRQYSLILGAEPSYEYVIGVKLDEQSRGGSVYIHNNLRIGSTIKISMPRNHFPLNEQAGHSVLIAGGIGITPIFSMVQRLIQLGRPWDLYYACRSRADMAFLDALNDLPQAHLHFDDERNGAHMDLRDIVSRAPANAHHYCCGPLPLMAAFEAASAALRPQQVHVEYFTPKEAPTLNGEFTVRLARSGQTLRVPEGRSILEVVEDVGVMVEHSCTEGICGTCETKVLGGIPDHRDSVLTAAEQAANNTMMICCSRSKSEELVLDL